MSGTSGMNGYKTWLYSVNSLLILIILPVLSRLSRLPIWEPDGSWFGKSVKQHEGRPDLSFLAWSILPFTTKSTGDCSFNVDNYEPMSLVDMILRPEATFSIQNQTTTLLRLFALRF